MLQLDIINCWIGINNFGKIQRISWFCFWRKKCVFELHQSAAIKPGLIKRSKVTQMFDSVENAVLWQRRRVASPTVLIRVKDVILDMSNHLLTQVVRTDWMNGESSFITTKILTDCNQEISKFSVTIDQKVVRDTNACANCLQNVWQLLEQVKSLLLLS